MWYCIAVLFVPLDFRLSQGHVTLGAFPSFPYAFFFFIQIVIECLNPNSVICFSNPLYHFCVTYVTSKLLIQHWSYTMGCHIVIPAIRPPDKCCSIVLVESMDVLIYHKHHDITLIKRIQQACCIYHSISYFSLFAQSIPLFTSAICHTFSPVTSLLFQLLASLARVPSTFPDNTHFCCHNVVCK